MARKVDEFHNRLNTALSYKRISQQELCILANINKGNMSRYANGISKPKIDKIELFARILGVSETWLMGYDVPMLDDCDKIRNEVVEKINHLNGDELQKLNIIIDTMFSGGDKS